MDALIQRLETQIRILAARCEKLERENSDLQQHNLALKRDADTLFGKNRMAVSQIENIISHIESRSTS